MSAKMTRLIQEMHQALAGPFMMTATLAVTGCTPNAGNIIPFPSILPAVPRRVYLTPVGNGAAGALVSLDTSQGAVDPTNSLAGGKLGVDKQNLYTYLGNTAQFLVTVEYAVGGQKDWAE